MSAATGVSRDRPPGPAPHGTAWGLGAIMLISLLAPSAAVFAGADWLPVSLDGLLGAAFGSVALALVAVMPLAAALRSRRYWVVCWYFAAGVACLALVAAGLVIGLAAPLRLVRRTHPDAVGLVDLGRAAWLACALMVWPLFRALTLHYWRPWSAPQTWETGDERMPRWASHSAGLPRR